MDTSSACFFCGGRGRAFGPYERQHVCAGCAKRVAELAQRSRPETLSSIWPSRSTAVAVPSDMFSRSTMPMRARAKSAPDSAIFGATGVGNFDGVVRAPRGSTAHISREDVRARLDLADAYREMDLYDDALEEAALALTSTNDSEMIDRALRLLLTEPLLKPGGFLALRARLTLN
jgi:hypothetical protein